MIMIMTMYSPPYLIFCCPHPPRKCINCTRCPFSALRSRLRFYCRIIQCCMCN
ncbi:uncharacterized protein LACBIDRAFT_317570 [Laccaria bicolor S238N-H82]|uniref:Predicted protein n=1 Tax=Laccaria bicolor (strain S238N-H82 / ATCC MYA-4686) TaxID=486041 RepID=B0E1Y8_LACBS|nr:uncharacterized protein LACBIDRAFT_317570 [Laccaria bicolor S238N-H82]EDQ99149.1 predicted protein [Laccaria bicolor S238N-H82]|eukprot:XP_001890212.1 predicted protein [Laccaria bicolor S238N-H82]